MSSSYPSSNHATHGSVKDSVEDPLSSSNSSTANSSSSSSVIEQQVLSASRIEAYTSHSMTSHTHRHKSVAQSVEYHTTYMKAYLDAFDATMAQYK